MGDADCTYDFRELAPFVEKFRDGYEFVMGSRFKGYIEPGSMPPLHRYFGTPFTTWILNRVYSSKFSDIHCGMRGVTLDALKRMDLQSQSWEYASEMVLKSVHLRAAHRRGAGARSSRTRRAGSATTSGRAGSRRSRRPGSTSGRCSSTAPTSSSEAGPRVPRRRPGSSLLPLTFGPITIGAVTFSLYWQFVGLMLAIVGLQGVFLGCLAQIFFDYTGSKPHACAPSSATRGPRSSSALVFLLGIVCEIPLVVTWLGNDLKLPSTLHAENYLGVTGIFLMVAGFTLFIFTLMINAALISMPPPGSAPTPHRMAGDAVAPVGQAARHRPRHEPLDQVPPGHTDRAQHLAADEGRGAGRVAGVLGHQARRADGPVEGAGSKKPMWTSGFT